MAHPLHHAESSARRYGGAAEDYIDLHSWFDATKAHLATPAHRALRHHTLGIFDAEALFGVSMTNSAGRVIPTRWIGEQHVREDCRIIPDVSHWLSALPIEPWMANGRIGAADLRASPDGNLRESWIAAVSRGKTTLGLQDWKEERQARLGGADP
jgi:hypothetical protein